MIDEINRSLTAAGIMSAYHETRLSDHGKQGDGAKIWLEESKKDISSGVKSVLFKGVGTTEIITTLARAFHLNGTSVLVLPIFRLRAYYKDAELRETIDDAGILVLLGGQDRARCNPLHHSTSAEVEYLIRSRYDKRKATFFQAPVPDDIDLPPAENSYWSDEFWHFLTTKFETMTMADFAARVA